MIVATEIANPFWDEAGPHVGTFWEVKIGGLWSHRDKYCRLYSWAIPDPASLAFVAEHLDGRAIEIGAGAGYWAWLLSQMGVDILAYDIAPPNEVPNGYFCPREESPTPETLVKTWYPVMIGGPEVLLERTNRTLFLCWPPYDDPMAAACLRLYHGNRVVYIGEGEGGCTGDDAFFDLLENEWSEVAEHDIVKWWGINDYITVYERKGSEE